MTKITITDEFRTQPATGLIKEGARLKSAMDAAAILDGDQRQARAFFASLGGDLAMSPQRAKQAYDAYRFIVHNPQFETVTDQISEEVFVNIANPNTLSATRAGVLAAVEMGFFVDIGVEAHLKSRCHKLAPPPTWRISWLRARIIKIGATAYLAEADVARLIGYPLDRARELTDGLDGVPGIRDLLPTELAPLWVKYPFLRALTYADDQGPHRLLGKRASEAVLKGAHGEDAERMETLAAVFAV